MTTNCLSNTPSASGWIVFWWTANK